MRLCSLFLILAVTGVGQSSMPRDILAAHNAVRASLDIPALRWSEDLARHAQDWADTLLANGRFYHRPKPRYGENLFEIRGGTASPERVVETWASEAEDYDYRSNQCRKPCGHYTQIVWQSTKRVGCAVARNARREVWVCNYDPPGNYAGRQPY